MVFTVRVLPLPLALAAYLVDPAKVAPTPELLP
jgi:hypothetical protein